MRLNFKTLLLYIKRRWLLALGVVLLMIILISVNKINHTEHSTSNIHVKNPQSNNADQDWEEEDFDNDDQVVVTAVTNDQKPFEVIQFGENIYEGNIETDGCKMNSLDPFNTDIMKYMKDFGEHDCKDNEHELYINVTKNQILISGYSINYVKSSEIVVDDGEEGFKLMGSQYLVKPRIIESGYAKDTIGSIQNLATMLCVAPKDGYDKNNLPKEIELVFSSSCVGEDFGFTFTKKGNIVHDATKKCLFPEGGSKKPEVNTKLILSDDCSAIFEGTAEGLLKHNGGFCVHPLWGGSPEPGSKLCLYPDCETATRLQYRWYIVDKALMNKTTVVADLKNELNYVEVFFADGINTKTFVPSVQPKKLESIENQQPSVFILIVDEISAAHFKRKLPLTYNYMMNKMKFLEYYLHSAVETTIKDNVAASIFGLDSGSESLFKTAKKTQHISLFSADRPAILNTDVTADHNSIPLFVALKKKYDVTAHSQCVVSQPIYDLTLEYIRSFAKAYKKLPKFAVAVLSEITKGNFNLVGYMDKHLRKLLSQLKTLNNTVIILQTVKGSTVGKLSQLKQGVAEYRRPFLATYVSNDIQNKYKFESDRSKHLTTPYDVYVTAYQLLTSKKKTHDYGYTLLEKTQSRNCKQAGVATAMCPCS